MESVQDESMQMVESGAYALDVPNSPSKMVVLSAKNNEMLARLFKVSCNYLSKSPNKKQQQSQDTNNNKKKFNEDLSVLNNSHDQQQFISATTTNVHLLNENRNISSISKIIKPVRDKSNLRNYRALSGSLKKKSKNQTFKENNQVSNDNSYRRENTANTTTTLIQEGSQQQQQQLSFNNNAEDEETEKKESTALKFVKRALERQASRMKERESSISISHNNNNNKEEIVIISQKQSQLSTVRQPSVITSSNIITNKKNNDVQLLAASEEKLKEIQVTNERLMKLKENYKQKRQEQVYYQLNKEAALDDTLRNISHSFDQKIGQIRTQKQQKQKRSSQKKSNNKSKKREDSKECYQQNLSQFITNKQMNSSILKNKQISSLTKKYSRQSSSNQTTIQPQHNSYSQSLQQSIQKFKPYQPSISNSSIKIHRHSESMCNNIKDVVKGQSSIREYQSSSKRKEVNSSSSTITARSTIRIPKLNIQSPIISKKSKQQQPVQSQTIDEAKKSIKQKKTQQLEKQTEELEERKVRQEDLSEESISELMIRLMKVRQKIIKNQKDINFKTIIEFKRNQNPSLECQKAAKCLCKLLASVQPHLQSMNFQDWDQITNYYQANSHKIVPEMCTLIQKCDIKSYNIKLIESIFKEIYQGTASDLNLLSSPKVKNSSYQSVLKYCYYSVVYVLINEKIQQIQQKEFQKKQELLEQQLKLKYKTEKKNKKQLKANQKKKMEELNGSKEKQQNNNHFNQTNNSNSVIKLRKNDDMPLKRMIEGGGSSLKRSSQISGSNLLRTSLQSNSIIMMQQKSKALRLSQDMTSILRRSLIISPSKGETIIKEQMDTSAKIITLNVSQQKTKSKQLSSSNSSQLSKRKKQKSKENLNDDSAYMTKQSLQQFDTLNYPSERFSGGGSDIDGKVEMQLKLGATTPLGREVEDADNPIINLPVKISVELTTTRNDNLAHQLLSGTPTSYSSFQQSKDKHSNKRDMRGGLGGGKRILESRQQQIKQQEMLIVNENKETLLLRDTKLSQDKLEVIKRLKEERMKSRERVTGEELEKKTFQIIQDLTKQTKI